jgi:CDP-diacylglycerol--glycerol-3-phosphate 3-phosphatidyltransferase
MNLPNLCTLSRVPMMFIIVAMLYVDWPGAATIAFFVFVLAGITDFLDGYLARKLNQVSNFGVLMDAVTDKVLLLGIMIALVDRDMIHAPDPLPTFMVLLILGREFLITGLRLVAASKGVVVSADKGGKQKTVTQILAVSAMLLAHMISSDVSDWFASDLSATIRILSLLGLALFVLATVFTVTSGSRYFRKYAGMVFTD